MRGLGALEAAVMDLLWSAGEHLTNPAGYDLDPALARAAGVFHTRPESAIFNALVDSAPDRWGENLMRHAERERARASAVPIP